MDFRIDFPVLEWGNQPTQNQPNENDEWDRRLSKPIVMMPSATLPIRSAEKVNNVPALRYVVQIVELFDPLQSCQENIYIQK